MSLVPATVLWPGGEGVGFGGVGKNNPFVPLHLRQGFINGRCVLLFTPDFAQAFCACGRIVCECLCVGVLCILCVCVRMCVCVCVPGNVCVHALMAVCVCVRAV